MTKQHFWTNGLKFWLIVAAIALGVNVWATNYKHNYSINDTAVCEYEVNLGRENINIAEIELNVATQCYENETKTLDKFSNIISWTNWITGISTVIFFIMFVDRFKIYKRQSH